ncbi:hypothetical protein NSQ96_05235 [Caldifermentibacillus hisashii]|uniref:hypothetical protein n=1 Tax=Caldifermentibacillus hisashii TaxID=996558 RepID=UPI0031FDA2C3
MGIVIGLIIIVVLCIVGLFLINNVEGKIESDRISKVEELISRHNIKISKRYDAMLGFTLINDTENKCLWCIYGGSNTVKRMKYRDIMQVELTEDDASISVTSRGSQLGGAIVGGALAGGVGAVIGGLSGKQTQKRTVKSIKLVITLDDLDNPFFNIEFARFPKPVETSNREYIVAHQDAFTWFKLMEVIIKRTEQEQAQGQTEIVQ